MTLRKFGLTKLEQFNQLAQGKSHIKFGYVERITVQGLLIIPVGTTRGIHLGVEDLAIDLQAPGRPVEWKLVTELFPILVLELRLLE